MWANHQQLQRSLIQDPVRQQTQQIAHPEFVDSNTCKVANFHLANFWPGRDVTYCLIEQSLLGLLQSLDRALKGRF